jgi:serine/threonine-protein kinase
MTEATSSSTNPAFDAWRLRERALRQLEEQWRLGRRPAIEEHLPATPEDRLAFLVEVAHLDLEYRLKAGEAVRVEEYFQRFPDLTHQAAIAEELIAAEADLRRAKEADLDLREYLPRFPQYAEALAARWKLSSPNPVASPTLSSVPSSSAVEPCCAADGGLRRRYRPLFLHARGGLGEIFVARDQELNRDVALKRIQEQHLDDRESHERFVLEALITGRLQHPGVVPVYGLGEDGRGQPCYAMRFIAGESLQEAIARLHGGPTVSPAEVSRKKDRSRRWQDGRELRQLLGRFITVCNTLAYAHSQGIIHRDLKPANIMLGAYGETLVVDWGLAKVLRSSTPDSAPGLDEPTVRAPPAGPATLQGQIMGTPAYMSPEQATGRLDVGPASDIYSLGATLFHLLTGQAPFQGRSSVSVLERLERGDIPSARAIESTLPPALAAICQKAMATAPASRYATALELAAELERWLADEPVAAYREPWMARLGRWQRRHRSWVRAGVVALLLVAVIAVVAAVSVDQARRRELAAREQAELALAAEMTARTEQALAHYQWALDTSETGSKEDALKQHRKALALREKLVRAHPENPRFRHDLANSHRLLGSLQAQLHERSAALASLETARTLLAQLLHDDPGDALLQNDLAKVDFQAAMLEAETGNWKNALPRILAAVDACERLVDEHADLIAAHETLARSYRALGLMLAMTGKVDEAISTHQRACRHLEPLVRDYPKEDELRSLLAGHYGNLANLYTKPGDKLPLYLKARDLFVQLVQARPFSTDYRYDLASVHNNIGLLQLDDSRSEDAARSLEQARAIYQNLVWINPRDRRFRDALASAQANLALLNMKQGRPGEALSAYLQAVDTFRGLFRDYPDVTDYQAQLSWALLGLSDAQDKQRNLDAAAQSCTEARQLLERLVQTYPANFAHRSNLGVTWNNLGLIQQKAGRLKEAASCFKQAIDHQRAASAGDASSALYRERLRGSLENLRKLEEVLSQPAPKEPKSSR